MGRDIGLENKPHIIERCVLRALAAAIPWIVIGGNGGEYRADRKNESGKEVR
jgi:hypothetical protein